MATISVKEAKIWRESRRLKQSVVMRRNFAIIQAFIFTGGGNDSPALPEIGGLITTHVACL
jgi:hypothetical protein